MKIITITLAALWLLASCNSANEKTASSASNEITNNIQQAPNEKPIAVDGYTADSVSAPPGQEQQKQTDKKEPDGTGKEKRPVAASNPDWDKKIIKTASLNLEVKDFNAFSGQYREKIKSLGGYVAQEEQNQSEYKIENTIVIKVPVDQFDNALALLTAGVEKVNERKVTSQDVSAEYIDTKSRIEAKKNVRDRYTDLLKQAKNMEEILNVQTEINGIQEEIESATGRINYLGHSAAFSTISLTYYQVLNATAKDDESPSLGTKTANAFRTGWGLITDLFVGLVSIWPLLLAGVLIIYFVRRIKVPKPKEN